MKARMDTDPPMAILSTGPNTEPVGKNGERSAGVRSAKTLTIRLAARKYLAALEFQDNPIAPSATRKVPALAISRKSPTSENAAVAPGTSLAYMTSTTALPKETAVDQAYSPTTSGANLPAG